MRRCRTYRYRLQPTVSQRGRLEQLLRNQCELYNAALEERRGAWSWERRSVSYVDQCRTLTTLRDCAPRSWSTGWWSVGGPSSAWTGPLPPSTAGARPGRPRASPRFKSSCRWDSAQWEDSSGWRLDTEQRRLRLLGIGEVKVRLHRAIHGTPKAITVAREGRRFWVSVRCVDVPSSPLAATGRQVGIDVGVCAQVATSDGQLVLEGRYGQRSRARLEAAQRNLARKTRGSGHRARAVEKSATRERTWPTSCLGSS